MKTPSVLAFEKKLVPSDGYMSGTNWEQKDQLAKPLSLIEKSVRGTISNRVKKSDESKLDSKVESPNLQTVDSCALEIGQDTLKVEFTLKVLGGVKYPSACNEPEFSDSYRKVAEQYIEEEGFRELARRYATNIANGRFLWRNRVGAEALEIQVKYGDETLVFDASKVGLGDFPEDNTDIGKLTEKIASALSGDITFLVLSVTAFSQVGLAQEVYPSQELVLDKQRQNEKSKVLYAVNGQAALHSQKIGNALRCIDTWYPDYSSSEIGPIPIDPYGAVTNRGIAYRNPKSKSDFYTLFDKYAKGDKLENTEQTHFVMAVLVRGGVFGKGDK